jgi:S1-C subfamily serine protease
MLVLITGEVVAHESLADSSAIATFHPVNPKSIATIVDPGVVDVLAIGRANHIISTGSGIVVSASGLLVTNNHVIAGAKTVEVAFGNPIVDYAAKIVARDPRDDIALLQAIGIYGLHPLPWARATSIETGAGIAVIGNAYGYCETPMVTTGQVMATNLDVTIYYPEEHEYKSLPDMIEVDAKVIPGDSGGVVVNSRGVILGMTTSTNRQAHVGYAIAASEVLSVIHRLRSEHRLH